MKALIHEERICEVRADTFPVAPPLYWVDVDDDTTTQDAWDGEKVVKYEPPPPERRMVPKSVVISRLTDEQLDAAINGMTNRQRERWRCPDSPFVYADDEEVIGMITAIGADPETVLAP